MYKNEDSTNEASQNINWRKKVKTLNDKAKRGSGEKLESQY